MTVTITWSDISNKISDMKNEDISDKKFSGDESQLVKMHISCFEVFLTFEFTPKISLMHYYCHVKLCIFHWNFLKFKFDLYLV